MGTPDLFVVCKNCQREVSPYITECPYCGHRLRKRAPKLERGGIPAEPKRRRRSASSADTPRLGRLRTGEIPGIRGDHKPYGTIALVLGSFLISIVTLAKGIDLFKLIVAGPLDGDWWRPLTAPFVYSQTGYEIVTLGAVFLFGWLLERRHGPVAPVGVFLLGGTLGMLLASAVSDDIAVGGNGAALALLAAWAMRDLLARRRGEEVEADLLGLLAAFAVLLLLPLASEEANAVAGFGGLVVGAILGMALSKR